MKKKSTPLDSTLSKKIKLGSMDIPTTNLMTSWSTPKPTKPVHLLSSKLQQSLQIQKKDEIKRLQNPSAILYKIQNKLVMLSGVGGHWDIILIFLKEKFKRGLGFKE